MSKLGDARFSSHAFRSIVATLLAASIPTAAIMCGGITTDGSMCSAPDAASFMCGMTYTVAHCATQMTDAGTLDCFTICGASASCKVSGNDVECNIVCAIDGRRPPGLTAKASPARDLAEHFARIAFFERASADAFDVLERELRHHGAPARLVRSARRAKRDELDHARRARRLGGRPAVHRQETAAPRSLFAIALDNAREGCARETFGALLGFAQAERAEHPGARRFYARVARDETRHASLSWRLHAWLLERLDDRERALVEKALDDALAGVTAEHTALDGALGVPDAATCTAMGRALRALR
jgi:hypothetical protein